MVVLDILNFLDELAPFKTAQDFDNVGLLIGDEKQQVKKVMVTLDLTREVLKGAKEKEADLVISHHPIIFNPLKRILKEDLVFDVLQSKISVISAHTNLDVAELGVSFFLANSLFLEEIEKPDEKMEFLRVGKLKKPMDSEEFIKYVSKRLGAFVRATKCEKKIEKVAVVSGSGYFALEFAIENGIDALVTGESKHDVFLKAKEKDFCFVDASHFKTENIFCLPLCEILNRKFYSNGVSFFPSSQKSPFCIAFGENIWD